MFADSFRKSVIGLFLVYRNIFLLGRKKPDSFLLFKIFLILRIGVYPFVQLMQVLFGDTSREEIIYQSVKFFFHTILNLISIENHIPALSSGQFVNRRSIVNYFAF